MFRLDQATVNGFTHISPEPMLQRIEHKITHDEKELWTLQNGELKSGLIDRLSTFQEKLDVLGKLHSFLFNPGILAKELIREWTSAFISILQLHSLLL